MPKHNLNKKIEKSSLIIMLVLFFLTVFSRLPTIFRPFDLAYECQLAYFGREAFSGNGFYSSPWSMKPPGETFVYGLSYLVFGFNNWALGVRLVTSLLASLTALMLYLIGRKYYGLSAGIFSSLIFVLFFSRSDVFGGTLSYAEMLSPFFTVLGVYLFFLADKKGSHCVLLFSGLSLGISLLFKQSAVYDFLPVAFFGMGKSYFASKSIKIAFKENIPLFFGFILPLSLFIVYILAIGRFSRLWDWMIVKPSLYAKLREKQYFSYIGRVFKQSFLVWTLAYLSIFLTIWKKDKKTILFIFWFFFTGLTFITSGKFWNYYFIQPFVPACLLSGIVFQSIYSSKRRLLKTVLLLILLTIVLWSNVRSYTKLYERFWPLVSKKINLEDYQFSLSEGNQWINSYKASLLLRTISNKDDKVLVIEGTPTTYVLSDKHAAYSDYLFEQQFFENKAIGFAFNHGFQTVLQNRTDLVKKLQEQPPKYIVLVSSSPQDTIEKLISFPWFYAFVFSNYEYINNFNDVWVYHLKKKIKLPEKMIIDPVFAKKYAISIE